MLAAGCSSGNTVLAPDTNSVLQTALVRDLDGYLSARGKSEHISTLSLSVNFRSSGSNINVAAGTTQYGGGKATDPSNLFQVGSQTKAFTTVAILRLEAAGRLRITQTLGQWLPQYPAWQDVKIQQLLNMTAGVPDYSSNETVLRQLANVPNFTYTVPQLVGYVYPSAVVQPPRYAYVNTNYLLGELVVEAASPSHSYETEVGNVIESAGLHNTFYRPDIYPPAIAQRLVSGYFANDSPGLEILAPLLNADVSRNSLSAFQGAGGIISNPQDIATWARGLYEGPILAPQQRQELLEIVSTRTGAPIAQTTSQDPFGFGLGVEQHLDSDLGRYWSYQGTTLGFRVLYIWLPGPDAIICVGANSQPPGDQDDLLSLIKTVHATLQAAHKI